MSKREYDKFGHFIIRKNPIFKTGILKYAPSEIGITSDKSLINVYRDPKQVKEVMDTLIGSPIIINHDMVCGENGSVGYSCSLSENLKVVGSVIGNVVIENGVGYADISLWQEPKDDKLEFSIGCEAEFLDKSGTADGENYGMIQTINVFNHLAFVTKGRAGKDVKILDTGERIMADKEKPTLEDVVKEMNSMKERIVTLEEAKKVSDETPPKSETPTPSKDKDKDTPQKDKDKDTPPAVTDSGMVASMVEQAVNASRIEEGKKAKAYEIGSKHVGAFSTATMDSGAVIDYVAEKLGIPKTIEAIDAYDKAVTVTTKAVGDSHSYPKDGKVITKEAFMAEFN